MPEIKTEEVCAESKIVSDICNKHGISIEDLQNKRQGKAFSRARKEIAKIFIKKPGLTHVKIAKLIGVHSSRIGQIAMEKKKKKKAKKPISEKIQKPDSKADNTRSILKIDFSNHKDIYDELLRIAEAELRTPENQALYMFKLIHEKDLEALKVEERLKFSQP